MDVFGKILLDFYTHILVFACYTSTGFYSVILKKKYIVEIDLHVNGFLNHDMQYLLTVDLVELIFREIENAYKYLYIKTS